MEDRLVKKKEKVGTIYFFIDKSVKQKLFLLNFSLGRCEK